MIVLYIFAGIGIATIALVGLLSLIYLFQDLVKQYKGKRKKPLDRMGKIQGQGLYFYF